MSLVTTPAPAATRSAAAASTPSAAPLGSPAAGFTPAAAPTAAPSAAGRLGPVWLEHLNVTVHDIDATTRFLLLAVPTWQVRGGGEMDWYGKTIRWQHVGDADFYLALQSGGEGEHPAWQSHQRGLKHVGLVVPSVAAVVQRLAEAGHPLDHWGGATPARRSAYVVSPDGLQFEFVEYLTDDPALRNAYGA